MQVSGWLLGLFFVTSMIIFAVARFVNKRNIVKKRELISLLEVYQHDVAGFSVSYEIYQNVVNAIGAAYRIDPRLLRPSDSLKKLYDLDSWNLGEGTMQLNDWVAQNYGITRFEIEPKTIIDLLVALSKHENKEST